MGSLYLQSGDYATYGLPAGTTTAQVSRASGVVDSWLRRPEGLIWSPDGAGNPCYMTASTPALTLTAPGAIAPGTSVQVPVTGALMATNPGDSLVLDRANAGVTEAVVVTAKTSDTLTLGTAAYAHSAGALLEGGLSIIERRSMPKNRPLINLMKAPVQRILAGRGRYAYSRRGDANSGSTDDFNLLAVYNQFGGPPAWEIFNPASTEFDPRTGNLWIPAGIMLAYYTEIEVTYVAGFSAATLPGAIKNACARIITALVNDPGLGAAKSYRAGDTAIEKFAPTIIDDDTARDLQPYRARTII